MTEDSMIQKIRNLLSKTAEAGCTEAEAMSAAAMAVKLMDRYSVSEADLIAGQAKASSATVDRADVQHPVTFVAAAIARFTGCTIFRRTRPVRVENVDLFGMRTSTMEATQRLTIIGLAHEVEIAGYLFDICYSAMEGAAGKAIMVENDGRVERHRAPLLGKDRLSWVREFQAGMGARMSETLDLMTQERNAQRAKVTPIRGTGRELAVVRRDLIAEWLKANGIQLGAGRRAKINQSGAYNAGQNAGAGVRFNSGVGNGQRSVAALR